MRLIVGAVVSGLLAAGLGGCGTSAATAPALTHVPSDGAGTTTGASTPKPPEREELVVGCLSVDEAECRFLAQAIVAALPADRSPAFAIEIQLYQCENQNAPCPKSLSARIGKAVVEFTDGREPLDLSLKGPPLLPEIAPQDAFYVGLTNPSSQRGVGPGPFPFEIGHCGVAHVIDFDGSFWLPIGQVDGDHPTIINSESGSMRLLAPNLAEFRGTSGFTVQLARFPGPKHFWGCD
jgi:hypothetical protein